MNTTNQWREWDTNGGVLENRGHGRLSSSFFPFSPLKSTVSSFPLSSSLLLELSQQAFNTSIPFSNVNEFPPDRVSLWYWEDEAETEAQRESQLNMGSEKSSVEPQVELRSFYLCLYLYKLEISVCFVAGWGWIRVIQLISYLLLTAFFYPTPRSWGFSWVAEVFVWTQHYLNL